MKLTEINQLMKLIDRELWIVTAADGVRIGGLVASFVSPISIVPELPRLAVAVSRQHDTWHLIVSSKSFAVHLLTSQQADLAWHFGSQSGRDVDKFSTLEWERGLTGSPLLKAAPGWLECRVEKQFETGDRSLYLSEVVAGELPESFVPLTQRQFLNQLSPAQIEILKSQMSADAAKDAIAIQQWRIDDAVPR